MPAKLLATLAMAAGIVLTACAPGVDSGGSGGRADGAPGPKKRLTVAVMGTLTSLSSRVDSATGSVTPGNSDIEAMVNPGLGVVDVQNTPHAVLAENVPSTDNGLWKVFADGRMETTWKLRSAARWHDGAPVTAQDILFTATLEQDMELRVFRNPGFDSVDRVEAPDASTIVVHWSQPYVKANTMFSVVFPRHLLLAAYQGGKDTFIQLPYFNREFIGAGAYQLREWREDSLLLQGNPGYVLGAPRIQELEVRFIPDSNALVANILANAVDLTVGRNLSLEQALEVRDRWREGSVDPGPLKSWIGIYPQFIDPNPAATLDVRFRRGLLHGIDRQQMADTFLGGLTGIAHSVIAPDQPEYAYVESVITKYEYDPRKAVQLIEALGYARGAGGSMRDSNSQTAKLYLQTSAGNDLQVKSMFAVADFWERIGFEVEQDLIPAAARTDRPRRYARPGFLSQRLGTGVDSFSGYRSSEAPLAENSWVGGNYGRYQSPVMDTLVNRLLSTVAQKDRLDLTRQIVQHMSEGLNVMGLVYDVQPVMAAHPVQGAVAHGDVQVWNVHQWDVRA